MFDLVTTFPAILKSFAEVIAHEDKKRNAAEPVRAGGAVRCRAWCRGALLPGRSLVEPLLGEERHHVVDVEAVDVSPLFLRL